MCNSNSLNDKMPPQRIQSFSSNNEYFACVSLDNRLLVWETSLNTLIVDYNLDSSVYGTCTSLHWISMLHKHASPKKAKLSRSHIMPDELLAIGTVKGDILLYNITAKNLFSHLVARHSDSINDMIFYKETNSFFTCSSDTSIAVWDIASGKQKSKWITDSPVSSICILDANNMLSASTSILWWNIAQETIVKKFSGHMTEIFKLLPVNAASPLNSCYFLSAAISDTRINAWSLSASDSETPVASFVLSGQPEDMDISRISSKDKPLLLSAVTQEGHFHLFEHTLNGNVNQPLKPKTTIEIISKKNNYVSNSDYIIATKISSDLESCIVACGNNKDTITFKNIKIKESYSSNHIEDVMSSTTYSDDMFLVKEQSLIEKNLSLNGLTSPLKSSKKSSKAVRLKEKDPVLHSPQRTPKSLVVHSPQKTSKSSNIITASQSSSQINFDRDSKSMLKSRSRIKDIDIKDPDSPVGMLLKGLQTQNTDIIDIVLYSSDSELISNCSRNLPLHALRDVLEELHSRLRHHQRSSPVLVKWAKEILRIHLRFITESEDIVQILQCIKEFIEVKRVSETIPKMKALKGLLSLLTQDASSDDSDSDSAVSTNS